MASQQIDSNRDGAEIYHGEALCKQKSLEILEGNSLPKGLLPVEIVELGHNRSSGFVWLKQKKKKEHKFLCIKKTVLYDVEVTMFVENGRMRNVTGVKSKEMLIWFSISDIFIKDPSSGKITFGTPNGLTSSFPVSAFELEEDKNTNLTYAT